MLVSIRRRTQVLCQSFDRQCYVALVFCQIVKHTVSIEREDGSDAAGRCPIFRGAYKPTHISHESSHV